MRRATEREGQARRSGLLALAIFAPALVGAVALAGASCSGFALSTGELERFAVSQPVERIEVEHGGNLELVVGTAGALAVERRSRYASDPPRPTWRVEDGVLYLDSGCSGRTRCDADYRIELPAGPVPQVDVDDGDVRLEGTIGRIIVRAGDGDVSGRRLSAAAADVSTGDGDVSLEFASPVTRVEATSDDGDIDVAVPAGEYAIDVSTGDGDVSVDGIVRDDRAPAAIAAVSDDGDVKIRGR